MALSNLLRSLLSRFSRRSYNRQSNHKYISKEVERAIIKGIKKGEGIPQIARRVMGVSNRSRSNATLTARTEVTRYQNIARMDAFGEAAKKGIQFDKQWIATSDSRTRDSHAAINGEIVPLDDTFSNGLMEPGDPDGPPEETCNCRCTVTAVLRE